jgi:o-succinylbenzoate synthase
MRIEEVGLEPLRLELFRPLRTARATYEAREGFVVRLVDDEGHVGWGEAMPLPEFGTESREACEAALRKYLEHLRAAPMPEELESLSEHLPPLPPGEGQGEGARPRAYTPAARHALEQALLDLLARRQGMPVSRLLSMHARPEVTVNALLSAEGPEALAKEAAQAVAQGYRTLKLKVGARPLEEDEARVSAVRSAIGPEVRLRVDANGAWTEEEAEKALALLDTCRLELCEQPLPPEAYAEMSRLQLRVSCPLAADESLALPEAIRAFLGDLPTVGILVLKPMVLGGLLPALALGHEAAFRGMEAYVTSSLDGVVARAGAAHLAAALPSGRHASGLAVGHLFRNEPVAHPYRPERGRILLPRTPGLGVHAWH